MNFSFLRDDALEYGADLRDWPSDRQLVAATALYKADQHTARDAGGPSWVNDALGELASKPHRTNFVEVVSAIGEGGMTADLLRDLGTVVLAMLVEYPLDYLSEQAALRLPGREVQRGRSLLPTGLKGVSFYNVRGDEVVRAGRFSQAHELRVPLNTPIRAYLLWDGELILHVIRDVVDEQGNRIGMTKTQSALSQLTHAPVEARNIGHTSELVVCAPLEREMQCFPFALSKKHFPRLPRMMDGKVLPMSRALKGECGTVFAQDYRRTPGSRHTRRWAPSGSAWC